MITLVSEVVEAKATRVSFKGDHLVVDLSDGRTISVPVAWYPRLRLGTPSERKHWRLIGGGEGIHWPDLDEDLSVENLVLGKRSGETQASLKRWWKARGGVYLDRLAAAAEPDNQARRQRRKNG